MEKQYGKITKVVFGNGGYQDAMLGVHVNISGEGWSVNHSGPTTWNPEIIKHLENCKWTEESRDALFAEGVRWLAKIMADAKVESLDQLVGKPVVCEMDGNTLKDWRIFTEVL